ncbi:hypothetical protein J3B02_005068, partial [Coemansia erecta]
MKEVITLQFGEQANYAGTHYWNLMHAATSEDADASLALETLYCECNEQLDSAQTRKIQLSAPRLLAYDRAGNYASRGEDSNANDNDNNNNNGVDVDVDVDVEYSSGREKRDKGNDR